MSKHDKLLRRILSGQSDANIAFRDLRSLLLHLGFHERTSSSHHLFLQENIKEFLNLQSSSGKAKAYQVRQTRRYLVRFGFAKEQ